MNVLLSENNTDTSYVESKLNINSICTILWTIIIYDQQCGYLEIYRLIKNKMKGKNTYKKLQKITKQTNFF